MIKESEVRKNIGKNVRKKRLEKDMTQAELAEQLSVSNRHISRIENGSVGIPLKILVQLCNVFDTEPEWFLTTGNKPEDFKVKKFDQLSKQQKKALNIIIDSLNK